MGHTVGKEIKTGICKDEAFLESLIGQMLSWGSGHLSIQALPVQQVIAKREGDNLGLQPQNPGTQHPPDTINLEEKMADDVHGWYRHW